MNQYIRLSIKFEMSFKNYYNIFSNAIETF